jgi:hypothetical protein
MDEGGYDRESVVMLIKILGSWCILVIVMAWLARLTGVIQ